MVIIKGGSKSRAPWLDWLEQGAAGRAGGAPRHQEALAAVKVQGLHLAAVSTQDVLGVWNFSWHWRCVAMPSSQVAATWVARQWAQERWNAAGQDA